MSRCYIISVLATTVLILFPASTFARTSFDARRRDLPEQAPMGGAPGLGRLPGIFPLSSAFSDTTYYGGTLLDGGPDPIPAAVGGTGTRPFKANRGAPAKWGFNSGVGSNFTEPTISPKPVGYHHRMEGWRGIDNTYNALPYYRRSTQCAISGAYSMYAGVTAAEALNLCYAGGAGYGNSWNMTIGKTFNDPGTGAVTLSYKYAVDAEPDYDYLYVVIDTTGNGSAEDVQLAVYTDVIPASTASHALVRGTTLRSTPGPVTIKFNVTSDGGYSDQDGGYVTTCGHSSVDDISLSGAISESSSFETGDDGWAPFVPAAGPGGEWSDIRSLATLPPPLSFCPCAMSDSVLLFSDAAAGHHGGDVDNIAGSPWCDLLAGGDLVRPGRVISFDGYFELPLTNYVFVQINASWYPAVCPNTGQLYIKPFTSNGFVYYFSGLPNCSIPGAPVLFDFSAIIPYGAEQVRVALGVLSYCSMYSNCTGVSNTTPWFDNVRLGVFGTPGAPIVTIPSTDQFQDNFAADGTLNPQSTARVDINLIKGAANPQPGTTLGDTLVVLGDGGNQEVRVVFKVRPGVLTATANLNAWAASKWTAEPAMGPGWYSARLDSAEQGGVKTAGRWMGTLHEADPKFGGGTDTDRGAEGDFNQLSHDIFPDHILTPGSRVDYFVKARFIPPDPRNPGGTAWYVTPDTTNGTYLEMEVLPSSMRADTTWNCTLYVDHHHDRNPELGAVEESGLRAALAGGSSNAEGTGYDRYDVNASTVQQASFGRPLNTQYGATISQTFDYQTIVWHSGLNASFNLVDEDASNLGAWLTITEIGNKRFWGSGNGLARGIDYEAEPTTVSFLRNVLGVQFTCDTIRLANCPAGSVLDSTYCVPLLPVAGAEFASIFPLGAVRGNGCPDVRSFDLLQRNTSIATTRGQLNYRKNGTATPFASVTNHNTTDVDYKTVVDGFANGLQRELNGDPHQAAACAGPAPAVYRTVELLGWLQSGLGNNCRRPPNLCQWCETGVPGGDTGFRVSLTSGTPNPFSASTRINYTVGPVASVARLHVFDVTGRLIRTLVDEMRQPGTYAAHWDGRDDRGQIVPTGLYFTRLVAGGVARSSKLIVAR